VSNNGNSAEKIPIKCPCGQSFSAKIPQPEISNLLTASMVVAGHEHPVKCLCGQQFVIGIESAQLGWGVRPLPNQSNIVIPQNLPKLRVM
jgi:hypothetical protein